MLQFLHALFETDFMPHVYCLRSTQLVWLHAVSDGLIAIAYFLIPFGLVRLVQKRRDLAFHWLFILFAVFILSCGATHVLNIVTLWIPVYRFDGLVKALTAASSIVTAFILIRLIPKIAVLPSFEQWKRSNEELVTEVAQRKSAELSLLSLNLELEKRVEARTQELEEKHVKLEELTAAWDLSHGLIRDMNGKINFWCEGSEQLYGWSKEESTGRISHELLQTQFPKPIAEIESELFEKGSWAGELLHITKSGTRLHVATHWVLQRTSNGDKGAVIEVNNDITDRLRAKEAAQRLADLVESSSDAIIGSTPEGIITSWNSSAERLFGYAESEMLGVSIHDLTPASIKEHEWTIVAGIGRGAVATRYETVRLTNQGKEIAVSLTVSPIRNSDGVLMGVSQIARDISEAKARQEAFRLSEERQRLAVEAGQVGLWYMDAEDKTCIWTQRCKELHGLSAAVQVPNYPGTLQLVHPDDRAVLESGIRRAMEGSAGLALEYRTWGADLRVKWLQCRGQAQVNEHGHVVGLHGTVIDLSARKEMEEKLRRANTELEQFAYAAAHDLQEPLRNVALAATMLERERNGDLMIEDCEPPLLTTVVQNSRRMEAMVKDLLAYSRALDVPEGQELKTAGDLVLKQVLRNLSEVIAATQAEISFDTLPSIAMQESHLLQVLQNLVGNALKYSGPNPPKIHVGVSDRTSDILICVRDKGIGIDAKFHERAFGMFKRLHRGATDGTGIGLAVCKRIVEHYGGKIWIDSEVGEGATFSFTIPLALGH